MQWAAALDGSEAPAQRWRTTRWRGTIRSSPARRSRYLALFDAIIARQASLIARWQLVGFIHGVMNTDNMALSGETIDYGPCAFMDAYDPATVFSSIDPGGRYAYGNQPPIAQWNLARLAEAMLPLFDRGRRTGRWSGPRRRSIASRSCSSSTGWTACARSSDCSRRKPDDAALVDDLLAWMQRQSADFTNTFRSLTSGRRPASRRTAIPS